VVQWAWFLGEKKTNGLKAVFLCPCRLSSEFNLRPSAKSADKNLPETVMPASAFSNISVERKTRDRQLCWCLLDTKMPTIAEEYKICVFA